MLHLCNSGGKAAAPKLGDESGDEEVRQVHNWDHVARPESLLLRQLEQRQQQHEARIHQLLTQHQLQTEEVLARSLASHPFPARALFPPLPSRVLHQPRFWEAPIWPRCAAGIGSPPDPFCECVAAPTSPITSPRRGMASQRQRSPSPRGDSWRREASPMGRGSSMMSMESTATGAESSSQRPLRPKMQKCKSSVQELDSSISKAEASLRNRRRSVSKVRDSDSFSCLALAICRTELFEWSVGSLILLNAISIGFYAEWSLANVGAPTPQWMEIANGCFIVFFALELAIRFLAEGRSFCRLNDGNGKWNMFDTFLVLLSLVDTAVSFVWTGAPDMAIIRVLRISRLFRAVRVIRIARFCSDLRILVVGIMNCGKMLMWSAMLLVIIMYIFGVCIMQGISFGIADGIVQGQEETEQLLRSYGTVAESIYTLFKALLGGVSWGEVADPLVKISPLLLLAFSTYIAFAMTCVLNIITGIFVDKAKDFRSDDKMIAEYVEGVKRQIDAVKNLFKNVDHDGSGIVTREDFSKVFYDLSSQAYFESVGLEVSGLTAEEVFARFDDDGDGTLNIDDFAAGVAHLRGAARKFDVQYLLQIAQSVLAELKELRCGLEEGTPSRAISYSNDSSSP